MLCLSYRSMFNTFDKGSTGHDAYCRLETPIDCSWYV